MAVMRRFLTTGALLALALLLFSSLPVVRPAYAGWGWCWWDPTFLIDGKRVDVYGLVPVRFLDRVPQGPSIRVTAIVNPDTAIQDITQDYQLYTPDGQPTGIFSTVDIQWNERVPRGLALFEVQVTGRGVPVRGEVWLEGKLVQVRHGTSNRPLLLWVVLDEDALFSRRDLDAYFHGAGVDR